jgi:hypothetical protein
MFPMSIICLSFRLSGTARQLLHILGEGLRADLQPFDHGQVREQLLGKILYGDARADRQHRGLDQLTGFRRDGLHAQ